MKIKKLLILILITAISILTFSNNSHLFFASSAHNSVTISPLYLTDAEFSLQLTGVSFFDINNNYIVFANGNSNTVTILNRRNKNADYIELQHEITYIKLTQNYLFIGVKNITNTLKVFNTTTKEEVFLQNDEEDLQIYDYQHVAIMETSWQSENAILIAFTLPSEFTYYYFSNEDLSFMHRTLLPNNRFENRLLSYVALSYDMFLNSNTAYVVADSGRLFKVTLDTTVNVQGPTRFYPDNEFVSLIVAQNIDDTEFKDYLVAVSVQERTIKVVKTTTPLGSDSDDNETTWAKGPDTLENENFKKGTVNSPRDAKFYNGKIYVSDNGTKSIQSFLLEILEVENKDEMNFNRDKVIIASTSAEVGRFSASSHVTSANNSDRIIVADAENHRLQVVLSENITEIKDIFNNQPIQAVVDNSYIYYIAKDQDNNNYSFTYYYDHPGMSNADNLTTYLSNTNVKDLPAVYYITNTLNDVFLIADNVFIKYSKSEKILTEVPYTSTLPPLNSTSCLAYLPNSNQFALYTNNQLMLLDYHESSGFTPVIASAYEGLDVTSVTIDSDENIFALAQNEIIKFIIENNKFKKIDQLTHTNFSDYNNISINMQNGNIYGFNKINCCIEVIAKANFNFVYQPTRVRTTTHNVAIYKHASGLNGENVEILTVLPINSYLNIYSNHPVYKNGNKFFVVSLENNNYGYVNVADVFFDNEQIVKDLHSANAKISITDRSESAPLLSFPDLESAVKYNLTNGHRIIVEDYSKENDFTFIRVYDENQQELFGYVQTKYVEIKEITSTKLNAIIILIAAIILSLVLFVFYNKLKEDRN